jgi:hypothetical protein
MMSREYSDFMQTTLYCMVYDVGRAPEGVYWHAAYSRRKAVIGWLLPIQRPNIGWTPSRIERSPLHTPKVSADLVDTFEIGPPWSGSSDRCGASARHAGAANDQPSEMSISSPYYFYRKLHQLL